MRCYNCGKTVLFGRSHTHHRGVAGGRWKKRAPKTQRIFKPNLQRVKILEDGKVKQVHLCMSCLKRIKRDMSKGIKPFLTLKTIDARGSKLDLETRGSKLEGSNNTKEV